MYRSKYFNMWDHQVIIINGLNKLYNVCFRPEHDFRCRLAVKPLLKLKLHVYIVCAQLMKLLFTEK